MEDAEGSQFCATRLVRVLGNPGSHLWLCTNRTPPGIRLRHEGCDLDVQSPVNTHLLHHLVEEVFFWGGFRQSVLIRILRLFSSKIEPGEILHEYRTTRFPDRFYNLRIGVPWADLDRRLDAASVLALCSDTPIDVPPGYWSNRTQ